MTASANLGHFPIMAFVSATSPERARGFYRDTLGLDLVSDELPFALVFDVHGVMLRVANDPGMTPAHGTVLGWRVPAIGETVAELGRAGIVFERYSFLTQDDAGIWQSPNGAKVAWFKDPDGNLLSLTEFPA